MNRKRQEQQNRRRQEELSRSQGGKFGKKKIIRGRKGGPGGAGDDIDRLEKRDRGDEADSQLISESDKDDPDQDKIDRQRNMRDLARATGKDPKRTQFQDHERDVSERIGQLGLTRGQLLDNKRKEDERQKKLLERQEEDRQRKEEIKSARKERGDGRSSGSDNEPSGSKSPGLRRNKRYFFFRDLILGETAEREGGRHPRGSDRGEVGGRGILLALIIPGRSLEG
jgi:hypothetical protein